ncbi:MAG: AAA family ATPase [Thermodesulfobacteriota bacterium]
MKLRSIAIKNFKGLKEVEFPLSEFVCLIGENNAGKSSVLQAFSLFLSGSPLKEQEFYDPSKKIRIAISFTDVVEDDLSRLAEEHRERISEIVDSGLLTLVRVYGTDGKSTLKYQAYVPKDERFRTENIKELVKGQRAGSAFVDKVVGEFPELRDSMNAQCNQAQVIELIHQLGQSLPVSEKNLDDLDLPTGIDKSVSALLPEPIYIQAVKDLSDETKTKESTPFGKILGILLRAIEDQLGDESEIFLRLQKRLNRMELADGSVQDERLEQVKIIESTVEQYVQESFTDTKLRIEIPPPELKTVLSGAKIFANDGVEGLIDSKGDGLRRATVFSILRAYADLSKHPLFQKEPGTERRRGRYLLLFEEPELYLHPKAQRILFEALKTFSDDHYIIVSTHSPMFLGPDATETFVKLTKFRPNPAERPYTKVWPVDLSEVKAKDQFQLICYENNNAAFFSDTVILVEGDSDYLVFPHMACLINPGWDCGRTSVAFARISGKSSIQRYKKFFASFGTRVAIIGDLDVLLDGFTQLELPAPILEARQELIQAIDAIIDENGGPPEPTGEKIRDVHRKGSLRALWKKAKEAYELFGNEEIDFAELKAAVDEFFEWERQNERSSILANCTDSTLLEDKRKLLCDLRKEDIYLLERGEIEAYYPEGLEGSDKPSKAQCFCNTITTKNEILELCSHVPVDANGVEKKEFEAILEPIFGKATV